MVLFRNEPLQVGTRCVAGDPQAVIACCLCVQVDEGHDRVRMPIPLSPTTFEPEARVPEARVMLGDN